MALKGFNLPFVALRNDAPASSKAFSGHEISLMSISVPTQEISSRFSIFGFIFACLLGGAMVGMPLALLSAHPTNVSGSSAMLRLPCDLLMDARPLLLLIGIIGCLLSFPFHSAIGLMLPRKASDGRWRRLWRLLRVTDRTDTLTTIESFVVGWRLAGCAILVCCTVTILTWWRPYFDMWKVTLQSFFENPLFCGDSQLWLDWWRGGSIQPEFFLVFAYGGVTLVLTTVAAAFAFWIHRRPNDERRALIHQWLESVIPVFSQRVLCASGPHDHSQPANSSWTYYTTRDIVRWIVVSEALFPGRPRHSFGHHERPIHIHWAFAAIALSPIIVPFLSLLITPFIIWSIPILGSDEWKFALTAMALAGKVLTREEWKTALTGTLHKPMLAVAVLLWMCWSCAYYARIAQSLSLPTRRSNLPVDIERMLHAYPRYPYLSQCVHALTGEHCKRYAVFVATVVTAAYLTLVGIF